MQITRDYLMQLAESKSIGSRRTEAQKENFRHQLKAELLGLVVQDMRLDARRGGTQVKELILAGRAAFKQDDYLANFSDDEIRAGVHMELLKELAQYARRIKAEIDSVGSTNTFLHQNLLEFVAPVFTTPGSDAQILLTKLSRTDELIKARPKEEPKPEPEPVPEPVPEPPKPKGILSKLAGLFKK